MVSNVREVRDMTDVEEKLITVIKRNGKKVDFDESKIALAIGKAFDNVNIEDEEGNRPYNEKDILQGRHPSTFRHYRYEHTDVCECHCKCA